MPNTIPWSPETGAERLQAALARISSASPELQHVFTQTFSDRSTIPANRLGGANSLPLTGALISVKDLFDVNGYVTRAGTRFMVDYAVAKTDAESINRLRKAGALLLGHTNMTELAYSGLGLNPHYGTPSNAIYPESIPGGSTAGGAVSVAQGVADIAIGTDTGGSLRIPAAFNGIVGFKPSQSAISRAGCKALSSTLDSVGPMANSVEACTLAFETMRHRDAVSHKLDSPVFVVPTNYGMDDLEPEVASGFEEAVNRFANAGFTVQTRAVPILDSLKSLPVWQFAAVEARAEYDASFRRSPELFDPRIASRLARADEVDAITYRKTLNERERLVFQYRKTMLNTVLLMPTVPILPPKVSVFDSDDTYNRINLQVLRNPSIGNVMDCCSISLPFMHQSHTVGIMLTAPTHHDSSLLELAMRCEGCLRE